MAWPRARRVNDPRADPAMLAGRIVPKRTGRADFPHPALGQDFTPSPTARHAQAEIQGELIKIKVYPIECI